MIVTVNPAVPTNVAPTVSAGADQSITLPSGATLDGSVTDDGLPSGATVTRLWVKLDGPGSVTFDNAASPITTATFSVAGSYTLRLTATDTSLFGSDDVVVVVNSATPLNTQPIARPGGPYTSTTGHVLTFDGSASTDGDNDPLSYAWLFGDGGTGSGATPTHTFSSADQFTVTLTVTDGKGGSHSASTSVAVAQANRPPVANAGGPYAGDAGSPIGLSGTKSSDPDNQALVYDWAFGDGETGTGASPVHVYAVPGTFTVTLTVTDGPGLSHSATTSAVIGAAADRAPPSITLSAPNEALPAAQVVVTAAANDNVGVTGVTFEVNGADPTQSPTAPYQRTVTIPALAAPGTKVIVKGTARDAANNTGASQASITIVAAPDLAPPSVTLTVPPEASPGASVRMSAVAADSGGVKSVSFSTAGLAFGTDHSSPSEATFIIPASTPVGATLTFVARAEDFSGNTAESIGTLVTVATPDTTPPTVTLNAPTQVEQGGRVTLTATAGDNVSVSSVSFLVDGVVIATLVQPPYAVDYDLPASRTAGSV
ncbi:MAG: PKD domain-containing protein, partial [Vicinamibacterales bacterium]